jgi:dUTP pyrophosphatase
MKMNIKLTDDNAHIPSRGSKYSAGYDLYAAIDEPVKISPHSTEKISAGIAIALPENTFGAIFARSGLATKQGLRPANCVGVIDADYRGCVIVPLHNDSEEVRIIEPKERIAQLVVLPFIPVEFNLVEDLDETERGSGGFGSTGIN